MALKYWQLNVFLHCNQIGVVYVVVYTFSRKFRCRSAFDTRWSEIRFLLHHLFSKARCVCMSDAIVLQQPLKLMRHVNVLGTWIHLGFSHSQKALYSHTSGRAFYLRHEDLNIQECVLLKLFERVMKIVNFFTARAMKLKKSNCWVEPVEDHGTI